MTSAVIGFGCLIKNVKIQRNKIQEKGLVFLKDQIIAYIPKKNK